jgi:multiple sugar transport system permease protein
MQRLGSRKLIPKITKALVLTVFVVLLAFPFYWMVIATFKQNLDLYNFHNNPFLFNLKPTLDQLRLLFGTNDYRLTIFFAIQVCISALLIWLWASRNKGRLYLYFQFCLAVLGAFVALRQAHYSLGISLPFLILLILCSMSVLLTIYLWKPYTGVRVALVLLLILDVLASAVALFVNVLHQSGFVRWLGNTAFVGALVVAITLLLSIPAAYALARLTGRWGERLGIGIFLTYLVPPTLLFIPLSRVVAILGLQDSLWSLVLVYPSVTIPFSTWLLMGFFKSIPRELEDAAMVDGLTRFGAFVKMVVPISMSGILTVVIFTFTLVTQEFVYALTFISPESNQMVGVGIPIFLVRGDVYFWGSLMAACLIASLPIAFLYNLFLDRFIAGFTVGAVKG